MDNGFDCGYCTFTIGYQKIRGNWFGISSKVWILWNYMYIDSNIDFIGTEREKGDSPKNCYDCGGKSGGTFSFSG